MCQNNTGNQKLFLSLSFPTHASGITALVKAYMLRNLRQPISWKHAGGLLGCRLGGMGEHQRGAATAGAVLREGSSRGRSIQSRRHRGQFQQWGSRQGF